MSRRWSKDSRWQETVLQCKKAGKPWSDPDFPPDDNSLYVIPARPPKDWPKVTEWKRVSQVSTS
jgi:hypothetical protein